MTQDWRRFGRFEVLLLRDGVFEIPAEDALVHAGGEAARQQAIARLGSPMVRLDVNCFVLRGPGGITLVDAGAGSAWGEAFGAARTGLRAAGLAPEQVDRVLLTHLHEDHVLGLFEGDAAYFPRAEILVPETDMAYFTDPAARDATPEGRRGGFAAAERVRQVYGPRVRYISAGALPDGIEALPFPGHSPGHTGYLVQDPAGSLLIWGDVMHIDRLQPADPELGMIFDLDPAAAVRTRRAVLDRTAQQGWIVAGSHVGGFSRVARNGTAFTLAPA